jgi:hypothetical protein
MINIDSKITIWDRFCLEDECKDELMKFLKEMPAATAGDILEWANVSGFEPSDHETLTDTGEEMTPSENKGEATLEVLMTLPDNRTEPLWDNNSNDPEPSKPRTNEEIFKALREILKTNGFKPGSKQARIAECSFIQGMMHADPKYASHAWLVLCLMSGRSILSLESQENKS